MNRSLLKQSGCGWIGVFKLQSNNFSFGEILSRFSSGFYSVRETQANERYAMDGYTQNEITKYKKKENRQNLQLVAGFVSISG